MTVTEGGKALFPVVLSGKVASKVTVEYTLALGGGSRRGLHRQSGASGNRCRQDVGDDRVLNTVDDDAAENTETFTADIGRCELRACHWERPSPTGRITDNGIRST